MYAQRRDGEPWPQRERRPVPRPSAARARPPAALAAQPRGPPPPSARPDAGSRGSAAASRRLASVTPRRAASSACCARTSSAALLPPAPQAPPGRSYPQTCVQAIVDRLELGMPVGKLLRQRLDRAGGVRLERLDLGLAAPRGRARLRLRSKAASASARLVTPMAASASARAASAILRASWRSFRSSPPGSPPVGRSLPAPAQWAWRAGVAGSCR